MKNPRAIAAEIHDQMQLLPRQNTPNRRVIRRKFSQLLADSDPRYVLEIAQALVTHFDYRGTAYELIRYHPQTFQSLGQVELERLGKGINSWWSVDSFARTLAGPAWLRGQISDAVFDT